jgi:hypothetical protein
LFFGFLGSTLVALGLAVGVVAIYLRFIEHMGFRPLLYLVILLIVLGLLLFILGFLAEGLAAIREELAGVRAAVKRLEDTRQGKQRSED